MSATLNASLLKRARRGLIVIGWVIWTCLDSQTVWAQPPQRDSQLDIPVMLVRNAITAVNHGNLTGNYTVLRDLGGPVFRERNSAAQLGAIFQRLRDQKTDLSPVLLLEPQFTEVPSIDQMGQLILVGCFPTQPLLVRFRLAFQRVNSGWAIDTISIATESAPSGSDGVAPPLSARGQPSQPPHIGTPPVRERYVR